MNGEFMKQINEGLFEKMDNSKISNEQNKINNSENFSTIEYKMHSHGDYDCESLHDNFKSYIDNITIHKCLKDIVNDSIKK